VAFDRFLIAKLSVFKAYQLPRITRERFRRASENSKLKRFVDIAADMLKSVVSAEYLSLCP
jgi:hypothetical protein